MITLGVHWEYFEREFFLTYHNNDPSTAVMTVMAVVTVVAVCDCSIHGRALRDVVLAVSGILQHGGLHVMAVARRFRRAVMQPLFANLSTNFLLNGALFGTVAVVVVMVHVL